MIDISQFLCKLYIFTYTSYTHYIMMVIIDASENPCILKVKKGFGDEFLRVKRNLCIIFTGKKHYV